MRPDRFPKRAKLEVAIIERLSEVKAHTLPSTCLRYGLREGEVREAMDSKASYIRKRLEELPTVTLVSIAAEISQDLEDPAIEAALSEVRQSGFSPDVLPVAVTPALVRADWERPAAGFQTTGRGPLRWRERFLIVV